VKSLRIPAFLPALLAMAVIACRPGGPEAPAPTATTVPPALTSAANDSKAVPPSSPAPSPTPLAPSAVTTETPQSPVDRIAYVGEDNLIYTIAPDGSGRRQITPAATPERGPGPAYTWPTWSPDAQSLLISAAVPGAQPRTQRLVVYLADEASPARGLKAVHQDRAGSTGILPGAFHYAIWSPDSAQAAIIGVGQSDLAVFISRLDDQPARPIIGGSPMYLTWSSDSDRLYVHQSERLMMFNIASGDAARSLGASTRYQAPVAAQNTGGRLAYVIDASDGSSEIVVSELDGSNPVGVAGVPHLTAIQWAPDGRRLAIGRTTRGGGGDDLFSYGELLIADTDTGEVRSVLDRPIFAFEWSPDGRRVLIAERHPDPTTAFSWSVLNVDDGTVNHLVDMRPTDEFGLMLVYFDQYAQSHRLWSPDGDQIVLAGDLLAQAPAESGALLERIWVIDAGGRVAPRAVADGYLAFWSPR
jgi:TolB protein